MRRAEGPAIGRHIEIITGWNRGWERTLDDRYVPSFDNGSAKLQYTFRL